MRIDPHVSDLNFAQHDSTSYMRVKFDYISPNMTVHLTGEKSLIISPNICAGVTLELYVFWQQYPWQVLKFSSSEISSLYFLCSLVSRCASCEHWSQKCKSQNVFMPTILCHLIQCFLNPGNPSHFDSMFSRSSNASHFDSISSENCAINCELNWSKMKISIMPSWLQRSPSFLRVIDDVIFGHCRRNCHQKCHQ